MGIAFARSAVTCRGDTGEMEGRYRGGTGEMVTLKVRARERARARTSAAEAGWG